MRKFLLAILTILILVLTFFFVRDGLELGNFKIVGVYGMQAKAEELDRKIEEAKELTEIQVSSKNDELINEVKKAATTKEKYETLLEQTNPEDIEEALKKEQYEIEKLWIKVGNYADEHQVVVNMQITRGTSGISGVKDLNFTVNGTYVGITEFIYDLEDDNELRFKIENFKMLPDKEKENLKATFSVKDIYVNIENVQSDIQPEVTEDFENPTDNIENSNTVKQNTVNQ